MRSVSTTMCSAGGHYCCLQPGIGSTPQHRAPSDCLLATRSVCRIAQIQTTHRATVHRVQHGWSSLAVSGHGGLTCECSSTTLRAGSLSHSSKQNFAVMSAAEGAQGDASSVPRATRSQLDHLFKTLWKEKDINTEGNCELWELQALEMETECGYIGYCYYMEEDARCLATNGHVKLTCGTYVNENEPVTPLLEVAQLVYDTALACDLPVQWDDIESASLRIDGFNPEEFADGIAGRKFIYYK